NAAQATDTGAAPHIYSPGNICCRCIQDGILKRTACYEAAQLHVPVMEVSSLISLGLMPFEGGIRTLHAALAYIPHRRCRGGTIRNVFSSSETKEVACATKVLFLTCVFGEYARGIIVRRQDPVSHLRRSVNEFAVEITQGDKIPGPVGCVTFNAKVVPAPYVEDGV